MQQGSAVTSAPVEPFAGCIGESVGDGCGQAKAVVASVDKASVSGEEEELLAGAVHSARAGEVSRRTLLGKDDVALQWD